MKKMLLMFVLFSLMLCSTAFADSIMLPKEYNLAGITVSLLNIYALFVFISFIILVWRLDYNLKKVKTIKNKVLIIICSIVLFTVINIILVKTLPFYDTYGVKYEGPPIAAYNSTFQMYEGEERTATEAKALINRVKAHNNNQQEVNDFSEITIDGINYTSDVDSTKHYDIEITDFYDNGAVKTIKITEYGENVDEEKEEIYG